MILSQESHLILTLTFSFSLRELNFKKEATIVLCKYRYTNLGFTFYILSQISLNYNSHPIADAPRTAAAASSSELTKNFGLSRKISKAFSL